MEQELKKIIADVMENPNLESTMNIETDLIHEVGLDSLGMINLLIKIEDTFDVIVDYEDIELKHLESFNMLVNYIKDLKMKQNN